MDRSQRITLTFAAFAALAGLTLLGTKCPMGTIFTPEGGTLSYQIPFLEHEVVTLAVMDPGDCVRVPSGLVPTLRVCADDCHWSFNSWTDYETGDPLCCSPVTRAAEPSETVEALCPDGFFSL